MKTPYSFLSVFRSGNIFIEQYINTKDDGTYFFIMGKVNYRVNSDGYLFDVDNKRIGVFRTFGANDWCYRGDDETVAYNLGPDLIKAERLVIERLIAREKVTS